MQARAKPASPDEIHRVTQRRQTRRATCHVGEGTTVRHRTVHPQPTIQGCVSHMVWDRTQPTQPRTPQTGTQPASGLQTRARSGRAFLHDASRIDATLQSCQRPQRPDRNKSIMKLRAQGESTQMTRQAIYRKRLIKKGRCALCGQKRGQDGSATMCNKCLRRERRRVRKARKGKPWQKGSRGRRPIGK